MKCKDCGEMYKDFHVCDVTGINIDIFKRVVN